MANPIQSLNENFFYNSMLARALIQLLPVNDRSTIRIWLERLHEMDGTPEEMSMRNDYMWFLLLMLQSKRIVVPFNRLPPTELRPLRQILPNKIYEEILTANDQNMSWIEPMGMPPESEEEVVKQEPLSSLPSQFLSNQPIPRDGTICYLAAFSDHDY